jgi:uncharacterized protein (TIGR02391 family)
MGVLNTTLRVVASALSGHRAYNRDNSVSNIALSNKTGVTITSQQLQIHPDIYDKCWRLYKSGDYDNAILNATKALEVAVRTKANLPDHLVGKDVMAQAFKPDDPILSYSIVRSEQEGMMALSRGIIMVFKNPQSHRFVGIQDKQVCLSIMLICSNLLYTISDLQLSHQGNGCYN